jgi:hypothetical protein
LTFLWTTTRLFTWTFLLTRALRERDTALLRVVVRLTWRMA